MGLDRISRLLLVGLALALGSADGVAAPSDKVEVETSSTSIYIGKVTLHVAPLARKDGVYSGEYKARVFPYFFMNEHGTFKIAISDEALARVAKGESVDFTGEAENGSREPRKVTGRATPEKDDSGKIKVRIFVTEKIQLIFNTTYKFAG